MTLKNGFPRRRFLFLVLSVAIGIKACQGKASESTTNKLQALDTKKYSKPRE
ncbi:MAG: hypothetical protein QNJ55_27875 [Xenococcus sp. MO_188.B8]|nr:hypothetical protein [Xenococcus sp. MO_188.B8]